MKKPETPGTREDARDAGQFLAEITRIDDVRVRDKIAAHYSGVPPYNEDQLQRAGKAWRRRFRLRVAWAILQMWLKETFRKITS